MSQHAVFTAIGEDRPGLVEEIAEFILEREGSIGDSRMANLRGQFAMMMLIGGTQEAIDRLRADLETLGSRTRVHVHLTADLTPGSVATASLPFRLIGQALDQPGLVHVVANVLQKLGVNIERMDTTLEAAPITGSPVFAMELIIALPTATPVAKLREELAQVCDPHNIDWQLTALVLPEQLPSTSRPVR